MNKLVIFDLWQTLVWFNKPNSLFEQFSKASAKRPSIKEVAFIVNKSDLFTKDIELGRGLNKIFNKLNIPKKVQGDLIKTWKEAPKFAKIVPGAIGVIKRIKKSKKIVLLTNIDAYGYRMFKYPKLLELFDDVFPSYKIGFCKPDLRCWKIINHKTGVRFDHMLMIGDSKSEDIEPAKKIGARAIQVRQYPYNEKRKESGANLREISLDILLE